MAATTVDTDFIHVFEPGSDPGRRPLLLLHGTGGDERDLLPLGRTVTPGAGLLSPRGKVLEGAAPRFFRRLAEGVFDEPDLRARTDELAAFVKGITAHHKLPAPIALGFSNGANIAAALLTLHPEVLGGAILLSCIGLEKDADAGGCWEYVRAYARDAGLEPLVACQRVLKRTCDAVALILSEYDALQQPAAAEVAA